MSLAKSWENCVYTVWDNQVDHLQIMYDRFTKPTGANFQAKIFGDTSPCGAGKTFTTGFLARALQDHFDEDVYVFLLRPKNIGNNWLKVMQNCGVKVTYADTYDSFRGRSSGINHTYLMNHTEQKGKDMVERIRYTTHLQNLIDNHVVLFVFDEFHVAKNKNTRTQEAVSEVARAIYNNPQTKCRMLLMSGSAKDKPEQVFALSKNMGLVSAREMYTYNVGTRSYNLTGIRQLYDKARQINPTMADDIYPGDAFINKTSGKKIFNKLFLDIFAPYLFHDMPRPPSRQQKFDGEFYVPPEYIPQLTDAINSLHRATNFKREGGEVSVEKTNFGAITKSLRKIEIAKLPLFLFATIRLLQSSPNTKVVVYLNYTDSIMWLRDALASNGYVDDVITVTGSSSKSNQDNMLKFQEPNRKVRIMISNPKIGGVGVSLDSMYTLEQGGYTAYGLQSPSYMYTDMIQAPYRLDRADTKEDSYFLMVYGDTRQVPEESSLINAMLRKSPEVKELMQNNQNLILPGDYERYLEYPDEADFPHNQ